MENKLELKHLAPYLPYGLRMEYMPNMTPCRLKGGNIYRAVEKQYKPLLIPLSELTDEQWIEVFKAGLLSTQVATFDISTYFNQVLMKFIASGHCLRFEYTTLTFSTGNYPFNQLAAFNKLFELHADVYGLIEANLALNKLEHGK